MYTPLVSIVIPVYNGSNYLAEAIDSALAQTYPHTEIIVVNDGSRDDGATAAIARSYGDKIRYFEKENGGSSSAINYGIAQMKGEWFSWLSHDDLYTPDKLEKEIACLCATGLTEEELKKHVVFSSSMLINASGTTIMTTSKRKAKRMESTVANIPGNEYLIAQPRRFNFHGCTCLIHKSVFEHVGVLDEKLRILNDVELWFRIYSGGVKLHYVPNILVKGRIHAAQVGRSIGYSAQHPESDMLWSKRLDWLKSNHPSNVKLYTMIGRDAYLSGRAEDGKEAFLYACTLAPTKKIVLITKSYGYRLYASARALAKKMYLKFRN